MVGWKIDKILFLLDMHALIFTVLCILFSQQYNTFLNENG